MAAETGGHLTRNTNDFTLGWARARRDLACRYTLGFYVRTGQEDRPRKIRAYVLRPGVRAVYPDSYLLRSPQRRRASLARAAFFAPELFQNGLVRAHLFPLEPIDRKRWRSLLAVDFPVHMPAVSGDIAEYEFGAVLRRGDKVAHTVTRKVTLQAKVADAPGRRLSFSEPVELRPGDYTLSVVLGLPGETRPSAAQIRLHMPEIPKKEIFVTEPVLGKRAAGDIVIRGAGGADEKDDAEAAALDQVGTARSFMPLIVRQIAREEPVVALTQACLVGKQRGRSEIVDRRLDFEDGRPAGTLEPVTVTFDSEEKLDCRSLVDILPVEELPEGHYLFRAALASASGDAQDPKTVRLAVSSAPGDAPDAATIEARSLDAPAAPARDE